MGAFSYVRAMRVEAIPMVSGGPRATSGPAPDPNALRRDRAGDAVWTTLPAEGFTGDVPGWPLELVSPTESALWGELWAKPQAVMWDRLGLKYQVAAYVRAYLESVEPKASAGLKGAVLRMEEELGLSLPGMARRNWKFAEDELGAKRAEPARKSGGVSAKDRLRALNG